jgi:hypothetical protein
MALSLTKWRKALRQRKKFLSGLTSIQKFAPEDIFIVGYPKSGNTWFQDLITAVVYGVHPAFAPPTLAQTLVPDVHKQPYYRRFATPMFFKSHRFPRPEYRRVVYLIRDGRDVMVSFYHYEKAMRGAADLADLVRRGHRSHGKWETHVKAWLANPHGADMIVIRYEDLKHDGVKELQRFCSFAGIKRDTSFLEMMFHEADFEKMQERELRSGSGMRSWPTDKLFRRRGVVGGYKEEMPAALVEEFTAASGETLRRCGYA